MAELEQGWYGVDLDGTLAEYYGWKGINHIGDPISLMFDRVRNWIRLGWRIKIFTARVMEGPDAIFYIRQWLKRVGLPEDLEITNVKDFAMIELWDDRCHRVEANTGRIYEIF